ncbi:unnamed protein product [Arctia plantaginis]|uniref:Uncharacterized protein n=1 Tax=Arctia plantaginis TaxID=874455 RepID=A0A8S0ZKI9_ARCPL|nr:unnamed protein product [Arctia plantaginis]
MEGNLNQIVETPPQLSRKPLVQKSSWECNRKKISRYSPKAPPDIRIPCQHFSKAYRCTSLAKNDIIKFNNAFYKSTKKIDQDNFILQHIKTSPIQRRGPKSGTATYANRFSNIWHLSCARKHKTLGYTIIVIPTKHVASPCDHSVFCDTLPNRHACVRVFLASSFVNGEDMAQKQ